MDEKPERGVEWQVLSDSDLTRRTQRFVGVAVIFLFAASLLCMVLVSLAGAPEQVSGSGTIRIHDPGKSRGGRVATRAPKSEPGAPDALLAEHSRGQNEGTRPERGPGPTSATATPSVQTHYKPIFDKPASAGAPRDRASLQMEGKVLEW